MAEVGYLSGGGTQYGRLWLFPPPDTIFQCGKELMLFCAAIDSGAGDMAGAAISPIAFAQGEGEVF